MFTGFLMMASGSAAAISSIEVPPTCPIMQCPECNGRVPRWGPSAVCHNDLFRPHNKQAFAFATVALPCATIARIAYLNPTRACIRRHLYRCNTSTWRGME